MERLGAGASVEPGNYSAQVRVLARRRITWKALAELLGEDQMNDLRDETAPTEQRVLYVRGAAAGLSRSSPALTMQPHGANSGRPK